MLTSVPPLQYVIAAYENNLEQAYAAPKYITPTEVAASFAKGTSMSLLLEPFTFSSLTPSCSALAASGKQVTAARIPLQVLESILAGHVGPIGAKHICEMHNHFEEYGCKSPSGSASPFRSPNANLLHPSRRLWRREQGG